MLTYADRGLPPKFAVIAHPSDGRTAQLPSRFNPINVPRVQLQVALPAVMKTVLLSLRRHLQ